jgi:hypothetical protein
VGERKRGGVRKERGKEERGKRKEERGKRKEEKEINLIRSDKSDSDTSIPSPASPATPVNIIFKMIGHLIIDDEIELLHIQTTCCNRGGDKDWAISRLEIVQDLISIELILSSVQGEARVSPSHEVFEE